MGTQVAFKIKPEGFLIQYTQCSGYTLLLVIILKINLGEMVKCLK